MAGILAVAAGLSIEAARGIVGAHYEVRPLDFFPKVDVEGRHVLIWARAGEEGAIEAKTRAYYYHTAHAAGVKILDIDAPESFEGWTWERFAEFARPRAAAYGGDEARADFERASEPEPTPPEPVVTHPAPVPAPAAAVPPAPRAARAPPREPAKRRSAKEDGERAPSDFAPVGYFPWEGRPWAQHLVCTERGAPKSLVANAITALAMDADWAGVLAYDEFSDQIVGRKQPPIAAPAGNWTDVHDTCTAEWLQRVGVSVPPGAAAQAVAAVASRAPFNPLLEYLERCAAAWDDVPRAEMWLCDFLGSRDTAYTREVARIFLVGAVVRALRPGCKLDTVLVLEGPQGALKSSAFEVLGGEWYSDDVGDFTKANDVAMQAACSWILELAELPQLLRSEPETVKAFLSRKVDKYRPPYGRHVVKRPRRSVFGGTTNNADYLRDDENRRFLPVKVGEINLEGLAAARDQLWGEAVHLLRAGGKWWLEAPEVVAVAKKQQELRRAPDEWENVIGAWFASRGIAPQMAADVTTGEILTDALSIPKERWSQPDQIRVGRILRRLKFERYQKGGGQWRYRRSVAGATVESAAAV